MDPEAALARAEDAAAANDWEEVDDALADFDRWIQLGGFFPFDYQGRIGKLAQQAKDYLSKQNLSA